MQKIKKALSLVIILAMLVTMYSVMTVNAAPVGTATVVPVSATVAPEGDIYFDIVFDTDPAIAALKGSVSWPAAKATFVNAFDYVDGVLSTTVGYTDRIDSTLTTVEGVTTFTFVYGPYVEQSELGANGEALRIKLKATTVTGPLAIGFVVNDASKGVFNDSALSVEVTGQGGSVTVQAAGNPTLSSTVYDIGEFLYASDWEIPGYNIVTKVVAYTSPADFLAAVNVTGTGTKYLYKEDGITSAMGEEIVSTGMKLVLKNSSNEVVYSADLIVFGDTNGDGLIEPSDVAFAERWVYDYGDLISTYSFSHYLAGDVAPDRYLCEPSDVAAIERMVYDIPYEDWVIDFN